MAAVDPFVDAIVGDQYPWGEFGRSEEDPAARRTREQASAKPHLWISSQAVFALVALNGPADAAVAKFEDWVQAERAADGWWTTRAGASSPRGSTQPVPVHNLRHTAKGLDLLACRGKLSATDVPVLVSLLEEALPDGSWPAYHGGAGEIWATCYVSNLIVRLIHEGLPWLGVSSATLRSQLDRGLTWLVERRVSGMWTVEGQEVLFTTEAVLAEIGALLAIHRPDVCDDIAREMLDRIDDARLPTATWALGLMWRALEPTLQAKVVAHAAEALKQAPAGDVFDRACGARLAQVGGDVSVVAWLGREAGGHESALPRWDRWGSGEYEKWCLRRAAELQSQQTPLASSPLDAAEGWRAACALIERWKAHVEQRWRSLWIGNEHVDEGKLQSSFETFAQGAGLLDRMVFSEVDTGRGPVDFVFVNGLSVRVYVEFKRSDHARLVHGATAQLPTYMRAASAEAGILVCVSFDDADVMAVVEVRDAVDNSGSDQFVHVIEVDGRRKASASTV